MTAPVIEASGLVKNDRLREPSPRSATRIEVPPTR